MSNQPLSGVETLEQGSTTWREVINKDLQILDRLMSMTTDVTSELAGATGWSTIKTYSIPNFLEHVFPFTGHGFQATASIEFANATSENKDIRFAIQRDSDAVIPLLTMGAANHAAGEGVYLNWNVTVAGNDLINTWGKVVYTKGLALSSFLELHQQQALAISTATSIKILLQGNAITDVNNIIVKDFRARLLK